ncbi:ABC transporter permease [Streptomyces albus]|uniref:ABC transporter permease n=1 Tax=Streptomyces sp. NRRL F-5639 TaxID=1463867 RepID=UPI0004CC5031|nr:ABC transporter permease [Streptomyces sp. NRRL F-5639]
MAATAPAPARPAGCSRTAGLRGAVAAEWTKLVSLRSTWYLLLGAAVLTGVIASAAGVLTHDPGASPAGPAVVAELNGTGLVVAALAMLAVTGEYATGSATTAFLCVPDRVRLLAAKSLTLGAVTFAAGLLCGVVGLVCGLVTLENSTFDTATVCGQVLGVGVHAALLSVLTVGLAAVVRRSAGTVTALFGLLFLLPMALDVLPGAETAVDLLPAGASEALLLDGNGSYGWQAGLALMALWALASLTVAARVLRRRDV